MLLSLPSFQMFLSRRKGALPKLQKATLKPRVIMPQLLKETLG